MDEKVKELMQELGNAINDSLSDSGRIAAVIGEIRRAGYDVFLVLEATIGLNRREDAAAAEIPAEEEKARGGKEHGTGFKWTSQDQKFLKALKISIDQEKP